MAEPYSVVLVVSLFLFPLAAFGSNLSSRGFQQTVRNFKLRSVPAFEAPHHSTDKRRRIENSIDDDANQLSKNARGSVSGVRKTAKRPTPIFKKCEPEVKQLAGNKCANYSSCKAEAVANAFDFRHVQHEVISFSFQISYAFRIVMTMIYKTQLPCC